MGKHKKKHDVQDICLSILESNLNHEERFVANFRNLTAPEQTWDVTPVIDVIRYNGKELLVKMLRDIHHDLASINIAEMTRYLNSPHNRVSTFSEAVPNQLYFLKELADAVDNIKPLK